MDLIKLFFVCFSLRKYTWLSMVDQILQNSMKQLYMRSTKERFSFKELLIYSRIISIRIISILHEINIFIQRIIAIFNEELF